MIERSFKSMANIQRRESNWQLVSIQNLKFKWVKGVTF